jgi:hypothetical protein
MEKFTNLENFLGYDFSIGASTIRVNLDIAFLTCNLTSGSISEFRIDLYLVSGVTLCEIEAKQGKNFDNLPFQIESMNYIISFQDYTLARNCSAIIEDWIKTLKSVDVDSFQSSLHKGRRWIRLAIHLSSILFSALVLIFMSHVMSTVFGFGILEILTINFGLLLFFNRVAAALSERAQASLRRLAAHSHIALTKGDENCFDWYTGHRRKSVWVVGGGLLAAVLINVFGGIITNMLPSIR